MTNPYHLGKKRSNLLRESRWNLQRLSRLAPKEQTLSHPLERLVGRFSIALSAILSFRLWFS